jgi:hypothetical protein
MKARHKEFLARWDADTKTWREKWMQKQELPKLGQRPPKQKRKRSKQGRELCEKKMGASHMEMVSAFEPETEVKTTAYQEMEAQQEEKEPTSADRKPEAAEQREAPVDDAEVMPVGEPKKKRRRD